MNKMYGHLKTINKHRWEVFKLCYKFGIPIQGLLHDLSKFSSVEFGESILYYTDGKCSPNENAIRAKGYSESWEHHKRVNKHHFEYWFIHKTTEEIPNMPFKYALEMFCDRVAASKVYLKKDYTNASAYEYFIERKDKYKMNDNMKLFLERSFNRLRTNGMKSLNKKTLKSIYDNCIK